MGQAIHSSAFLRIGKSPILRGAFFVEEALAEGLALVEAKASDMKIFWLVNPETEQIVEAKYYTYGGPSSIAVGEAYSAMILGQTIKVALTITGEDVERSLRDDPDTPAAPIELFGVIDRLAVSARENYPAAIGVVKAGAVVGDSNIAIKETGKKVGNWSDISKEEQIKKIEAALDGPIRDYLRMEGGDVEIVDLIGGHELLVTFHGMCGSCASSTGATLFAIESALRDNVNSNLTVINANQFA